MSGNNRYAHPLLISERIAYVLYCLRPKHVTNVPMISQPHTCESNNQPSCIVQNSVASSYCLLSSQLLGYCYHQGLIILYVDAM